MDRFIVRGTAELALVKTLLEDPFTYASSRFDLPVEQHSAAMFAEEETREQLLNAFERVERGEPTVPLVDHPQVDLHGMDHGIPDHMREKLPAIIETADWEFWRVVAEHLPDITTGDMAPDGVMSREIDNVRTVTNWVTGNLPHEMSEEGQHEALLEQVAQELRRRGIECTIEHPGCVAITVREGVSAWTGMHNYQYASVNVLVDDKWEPAENITLETTLSEDASDPVAIAEAWAETVDANRIAYARMLRKNQERFESFAAILETNVQDEFTADDPQARDVLRHAHELRETARDFQRQRMDISSSGYQRMMGEANLSWSSIVQALRDAGFPETSVWQTGGGCLAIGINLKGERHAMLTTKDGVLSVDRSAHKGEQWMLGLYLTEDEEMSGEGFVGEVFGTDAGDPETDTAFVARIKPFLDLIRGQHDDAYFVWLAEESRHEISGPYETPGDALADKSNYPTGSELAICDTNGNFIPLQF